MNKKSAVAKIEKAHALLVFPVNNAPEPRSLWSEFFPRKKMRWEWDDNGDNSVAEMWHLMKELSDCRKVVYSKWYQGRATFFSRDCFRLMLCVQQRIATPLTPAARRLFEALEDESPLSTKQLKKITGMQGRYQEPAYSKALKELFQRLQIVAFGEVDDGAFPSLALGLTKLIYDDLWNEALDMDAALAAREIEKLLPLNTKFGGFFAKTAVIQRPLSPTEALAREKLNQARARARKRSGRPSA